MAVKSSSKKPDQEPTLGSIGFPVFALSAVDNRIFVGGGGGSSRTGVLNSVLCFERNDDVSSDFRFKSRLIVPQDLGAIMNMELALGDKYLLCGIDNFCHVASINSKDSNMALVSKFQTDFKAPKNAYDDPYQKVVRSSGDYKWIATGGTDGKARLWKTEPIETKEKPFALWEEHFSEINDVAFSSDSKFCVTVSSEMLCVRSFGEGDSIELKKAFVPEDVIKKPGASFKLVRFGAGETASEFYTAIIDKERQSHVVRWTLDGVKILGSRIVGKKPITALAASPDGLWLGFGTSEGSVGLISTRTMKQEWKVASAHGFTVTAVTFDSVGKYLISGSADTTCKVFPVSRGSPLPVNLILFLVAIFMIVVAYVLSQMAVKLE